MTDALDAYEVELPNLLGEYDLASLAHFPENAPRYAVAYGNHAAMRRDLVSHGSHFFDRGALRFFNARTSDDHMAGGRFWVESDKFEDDPRRYRVAWVIATGDHRGVERSIRFDSLAQARKARSRIAARVQELEDGH